MIANGETAAQISVIDRGHRKLELLLLTYKILKLSNKPMALLTTSYYHF